MKSSFLAKTFSCNQMPNSKSILKAAVQGVIWKTALLKIFRNRKRFLRLYVNPFSNYIQNKSIFEIAIRTPELATEAVYNFPKKFHHTCLTVSLIQLWFYWLGRIYDRYQGYSLWKRVDDSWSIVETVMMHNFILPN